MSHADPRRSWGFRRRVALARAAAAFEAAWVALWPSLALVGVFLVVSLLGLWALLPAWLHALGARRAGRRPDLDPVAGARQPALAQPRRRVAPPGAGQRVAPSAVALARRPPVRAARWTRRPRRSGGATRSASRGRSAASGSGAPRSDLPRRDPWALRAALLLLLLVALVEAGGLAPKRLLQAFELQRADPLAKAPVELTLWVTPPIYTGRPPVRLEVERPAPGEPAVVRAPATVSLPAGSEALAQLHHLSAPAATFALALGGQSKAFVAIAEDSAEASLLIGLSGQLRVGSETEELGVWNIEAIPDQAPSIEFAEAPTATHRGVLRSQFLANDDYGVTSIALADEPSRS